MGERKVLNKYYPPDFDPAKLPRGQRGNKDAQMKVRMMLAMSVRCNTCGNYMYKGTKFNMRMEDVVGEDYLGIKIFRFYFHCKNCSAEITMKTDPKNSDYAMEHGATRNYEPWRNKDKTVAEAVTAREEEERGNAMKALENRTNDSKVEMDIMDALEELQALNSRHGSVNTEAALAALQRSAQTDEEAMDAADAELVKRLFSQRATQVQRVDESAATAALADAAPPPSASPLTRNEHWDGGAGAAAAAEAAAPPPRKPAEKPPVAARVAIRPKFAVKPKQAAPAAAAGGAAQQNGSGSNAGAAHGGGVNASASAAQPGKRPAEDAGLSAAEPAAKKPAAAPHQNDESSPARSGGGGGGGLTGLLGDYGSGSNDSSS